MGIDNRINPADTDTCPPSLIEGDDVRVETLPNGTRVFTDKNHRIGTDALLLTAFCELPHRWPKGGGAADSPGNRGRPVPEEWGCAPPHTTQHGDSFSSGEKPAGHCNNKGHSGAENPGSGLPQTTRQVGSFSNRERPTDLSLCDLASGCGVLVLGLLDRGLAGRALGIEIDPGGDALLRAAIEENGFSNLTALCADFRDYKTDRPFDLVVSNPPYFNAGKLPPGGVRAAARHEERCTIAEVCAAAGRLLKDRGRFCLCYPPARLADLFAALRESKLEPKRLQLVRKGPGSPPWLALVEARRGGGVELKILPDRILPPGRPVIY